MNIGKTALLCTLNLTIHVTENFKKTMAGVGNQALKVGVQCFY